MYSLFTRKKKTDTNLKTKNPMKNYRNRSTSSVNSKQEPYIYVPPLNFTYFDNETIDELKRTALLAEIRRNNARNKKNDAEIKKNKYRFSNKKCSKKRSKKRSKKYLKKRNSKKRFL